MDKNKPSESFQYGIKGIKMISFSVNEDLYNDESIPLKVQFRYRFTYDLENEILKFVFGTIYYTDELTVNKPVVSIDVENDFYIENLKDRTNGDIVTLPDPMWVTLVSLSITHTRSILAIMLAATKFKDRLIPIINPLDVAKAFFPDIVRNMELAAQSIEGE